MKIKYNKILTSYIIFTSSTIVLILSSLFFYSKTLSEKKKLSQESNATNMMQSEPVRTIPEGFPESFPVYYPSTMTNYWVNQNPNLQAFSVIWQTNSSFRNVVNFYKDKLSDWKLSIQNDTTKSFTGSFEGSDGVGFIGITTNNSNVLISVTLGVRK